MRPDGTTKVNPVVGAVYYVLGVARRVMAKKLYFIDDPFQSLTYSLAEASRYSTPAQALQALHDFAIRRGESGTGGCTGYGIDLIRVTESHSAPRRELVTSGDLSLLNEGPVVIFGACGGGYLQPSEGLIVWEWSYRSEHGLQTAKLFRNQQEALQFIADVMGNDLGPIELRVIREVPGETIVTEAVLA